MIPRGKALCCTLFHLLLLSFLSDAQTWPTGDNSTVIGCSSHCSVDDASGMECWERTRHFFEKVLVGQLRHYIAVQVNIDQWWRRHGKSEGEDFQKVREQMIKDFRALHRDEDVLLSVEAIEAVANQLADRVQKVSNRTIGWPPHFECPIPCEYRHSMYRNLFVVSMILNVALFLAAIPFIMRMMKVSASEGGRGRGRAVLLSGRVGEME